jgi:site-specific DNA-methyltransferase (adenine-specific)/site-specific DNA-methyltransferase (cytosine-N4-specific)
VARRTAEGLEIIAGHTRHKAAVSLGLDRVPVRVMDLNPDDARLLALADNRIGEIAEWSDDLSDLLIQMDSDHLDLDGLGWNTDELSALLNPDYESGDIPEPEPEPPPENPDSQAGEVYQLGPHRLLCGDCRDPEDVARLLDGCRVNVAFTSPPYASQRKYDESSGFKPIAPDDYVAWFDAVQENVRAHLAEDGSWFVNIKEHCEDGQRSLYVKDLTIAHVREWGWMFVDEFVWTHGGTPKAVRQRFKNGWEPVFHYAIERHKFRPDGVRTRSDNVPAGDGRKTSEYQGRGGIFDSGATVSPGLAYPSNNLSLGKNRVALGHSAAFPTALPDFFIRAYSDPGDAIFDPFMGSGSTLIAAAKNDRIGYGLELSPGYCDVIRRRWTRWALDAGHEPGPGALHPDDGV